MTFKKKYCAQKKKIYIVSFILKETQNKRGVGTIDYAMYRNITKDTLEHVEFFTLPPPPEIKKKFVS